IVDFIFAGVHAARRNFVQQRLPKMYPATVYQRDAYPPAPAEPLAEPGHELEPRRAAAHHDNAVKGLVPNRPVRAHLHLFTFEAGPRIAAGVSLGPLRAVIQLTPDGSDGRCRRGTARHPASPLERAPDQK